MSKVRVQSTSQAAKSLQQYDDLRARGDLKSAVIICEDRDGNFQVLGQGMDLTDIGIALLAAAEGVKHAVGVEKARDREIKLGSPAPERPPPRAEVTGRKREPEITRGADGDLQAPAGEAFSICGECGSSKWFVTTSLVSGAVARCCCTSCGNELKMIPALTEGHA